jgi:hypothetical protein
MRVMILYTKFDLHARECKKYEGPWKIDTRYEWGQLNQFYAPECFDDAVFVHYV